MSYLWNHNLIQKRTIGYDVGFNKDEYGCNSNKCECAKTSISRNLQSANEKIEALQNQLDTEKAANENLRNLIRQLENEQTNPSESFRNQKDVTNTTTATITTTTGLEDCTFTCPNGGCKGRIQTRIEFKNE